MRQSLALLMVAITALVIPGKAAAVGSSNIIILRNEDRRLEGKIDSLRREVDQLKRRVIRLTSECDGQRCILKEAVPYGAYGECMRSIDPTNSQGSLCVPLYGDPIGDVPSYE